MRTWILAASAWGLLTVPTLAQSVGTLPPAAPPNAQIDARPGLSTSIARQADVPPAAGGAALSSADKAFVLKAAQGNLAEVQAGQMAQQKATSPAIKQFGGRMVDDHSKNEDMLSKLLDRKGLTPPADPSPMQQQQNSRLEAMDGERFAHAYLRMQMRDHQAMLRLFQREAASGSDPDVRAFAKASVPVIESHIAMLKSLEQ